MNRHDRARRLRYTQRIIMRHFDLRVPETDDGDTAFKLTASMMGAIFGMTGKRWRALCMSGEDGFYVGE